MAKIKLDPNQPLSVGDHVELHFKSTGLTWIKATQIYLLEKKLEGRTDFRVDSISTPTLEPTSLVFTVEILKTNPIVMTAGFVAIVIAGAAATIVFSLSLVAIFLIGKETVEKVVTSPAAQVAIAGTGLALPIIAGILLLGLLKK